MPATLRNVAKTDTLETQRQKINQIAQDVYNIAAGGSDLATGNLKLGDGTRTTPSLAFTSDETLGIYKPAPKTIGYVSDGKKVADFAPTGFYSFRDLVIQKKLLINSGLSVNNFGENYDAGSYTDIPLVGGTGEGALASFSVIAYDGSTTNSGENYNQGSYQDVVLVGGSGSGATVGFTVPGIQGNITNAGSAYIPGIYPDISLINGSGSGVEATLTITGETVLSGTISNPGSGYTQGIYTNSEILNVPLTTYTVTTVSNPGTPPPNNVYQINGTTQQALTLIKGNTYRFDTSDSSNQTHPLIFQTLSGQELDRDSYVTVTRGNAGNPNSFVDLIIKPDAPTETIKYNCSSHDGMGANISIISGSSGNYGNGAIATVTINSSGQVSDIEFTFAGEDYNSGNTLQVYSGQVGSSGSGFLYTLNAPTYTGTITSVIITNNGINYLQDDVLSVSSGDLGGSGSGFEYTISTEPGKIINLSFTDRGEGYEIGDTLNLPSGVSNVSSILKGEVTGVIATLDTGTTDITISSTAGIVEGMDVIVTSYDPFNPSGGNLPPNTTVLSVNSSTEITLSNNPSISGVSTLTFRSTGVLTEISVASVSGIEPGYLVSKVSGSGVLANNTTVQSINTNTNIIVLSNQPTTAGSIVLDFLPPFGVGTTLFEFEIEDLGVITSVNITDGGNGYSVSDQLTVNETNLTQPILYNVQNKSLQIISFVGNVPGSTFSVGDTLKQVDGIIQTFTTDSTPEITPSVVGPLSTTLSNSSTTITVSSTSGISEGMVVTQGISDVGQLSLNTTVDSVVNGTTIVLSTTPSVSGTASLTFTEDLSGTYTNVVSTTDNDGLYATFNISRGSNGFIQNITINNPGKFYQTGDQITIDGGLVGGSSGSDDIAISVNSVSVSQLTQIIQKTESGGNIESLLIEFNGLLDGNFIIKNNTFIEYEIDSASSLIYRYFINLNDGNGYQLTPNLTLYSGSTYQFNLSDSSNNGHVFSLSEYRDGIWSPSFIENIETTLSTNTAIISVTDATGIVSGMSVSVVSGEGTLLADTSVVSVNGNSITLSSSALSSGSAVLNFRGNEYTDGVTRSSNSLSIKVTNNTPNLYYYCGTNDSSHVDEGGADNQEAVITIDTNNPKTFGSGFLATVLDLQSSDIIKGSISSGDFEAVKFIGEEAELDTVVVGQSLSSPSVNSANITVNTIISPSLSITTSSISTSGNLNIGSTIQLINSSGNITTSGVLKTTNSLNINDRLTITNNNITSTTGNNILLSPAVGRVAKINTTSALTIPSGTTAQRPTSGIVENGSIRFNTETGQYEGYSAATSSWSSLGGVRDLDGNTYIAAEASIGANDNTLYFYNDGNNTINVTASRFIFNTVKSIDSPNPLNPVSVEWSANTPVDIGDYLYYGLNVYEVTGAGTTGTSGNEPTHTTGTLSNGSAQLTWYAEYASDITFNKVANVNINTNLVFNDELKLFDNKITTLLSDIVIEPFAGKKVDINTNTSLVLPNGTTAERGIPGQGSVRFNTSLSQFEGYNGVNWTSLGGVRDVDGNTYIIPETSPGSNENILYFFNDGDNTLRLSTTELTFDTIDQIGSTSGNLDLQAQTVTFNSLALTIDTSVSTDTTLLSTQDNFNIALSSGLTTDPLLRLTNAGEIYINQTFGTGSNSLLKVLDKNLNKFELDDVITETSEYILTKGTTDSGASVIFDPTLHSGAKVIIIADNTTADDREMIEFTVIAKGTDIFHTEYGNVVSGDDIISPSFDFDAGGNVRLNAFLASNVAENDVVNITVVSTVIKR